MTDPARRLARTLEDRGLRWEVISHAALPGGAIAWLRVSPAAEDLASAMLARDLVIEETGDVPRLRVCNPQRGPVLLPADLVVDGGKQARVVERSLIVPGFSVVDVPVRCVEQGRWHARDTRTATTFAAMATATTGSREELLRMKRATLRRTGDYTLEQREVWDHVDQELHRTRTTTQTRSYTAFLSVRAERVAEARRLDIQAPTGANGLALIRRGSVWIEVFPTRDDMSSIVPAVVADALDGQAEDPSRVDVAVHAIANAPLAPIECVAGTLGESFALDGAGVTGFALLHRGGVAHIVASAAC
ncbi:MAG TPA: DUF6569 family protein [Labilithrix sp.]|jgi:hypothetical protein